jgi:hypothetical protein
VEPFVVITFSITFFVLATISFTACKSKDLLPLTYTIT